MSRILAGVLSTLVLVLGAKAGKPAKGAKASAPKPAHVSRASSIAGTWRIEKGIRGAQGGLTEEELRDYLGKLMVIDGGSLSFIDRTCPAPNLTPRVVPAEEAFDDPSTAQKLGVKGDVRSVDTTCADPAAQLLWLSDDRVVFQRDGEWLIAHRR